MFSFIKKLFGTEEIVEDPMKYLIVGLGNMEPKYDDTRHNVGFEIVDYLAQDGNATYRHESLGDLAMIKHKGRSLYLLKPSTYMNLSGKAVRYWITKLKIQPGNLLVVLDDLNLKFGQVRLKGKGSDGGHNGLKNIDQLLGRNNYARLRIGIGKDFHKGEQINYVLGKWNKDERKDLPDIIKHCADACKSYSSIGLSHTMNKYNK